MCLVLCCCQKHKVEALLCFLTGSEGEVALLTFAPPKPFVKLFPTCKKWIQDTSSSISQP
jgi:hypothetical protein